MRWQARSAGYRQTEDSVNGWLFFFLGLLFTVPLNIASQYLMGPFQRWFDASRANLSGRRKRQLKDELWRVKVYHDDPVLLHTYLLRTILMVLVSFLTLVMLFVALVTVFGLFAANSVNPGLVGIDLRHMNSTVVAAVLAGILLVNVVAMFQITLTIQVANRALVTVIRVRTFEKFERKTLELLGKEGLPEKPDAAEHET
jgi:hypothetical protein